MSITGLDLEDIIVQNLKTLIRQDNKTIDAFSSSTFVHLTDIHSKGSQQFYQGNIKLLILMTAIHIK